MLGCRSDFDSRWKCGSNILHREKRPRFILESLLLEFLIIIFAAVKRCLYSFYVLFLSIDAPII